MKKMKRKKYEKEMRILHGELVAMQEWVKASGAKICIVFEGRDTAGKGGTIKRITERVSPQVSGWWRCLPRPSGRNRRCTCSGTSRTSRRPRGRDLRPELVQPGRRGAGDGLLHSGGDRPVPGLVPGVEKAMTDSGILLLKYWLEVSPDEQTRRLESRINDLRKVWKLSDLDLKSYSRWYDYSRARDAMFAATDTDWVPWYLAHSDDKKRARLNIISHLLSQVPYKPLAYHEVTLPKWQRPQGNVEPDRPLRYIPTPF